MAPELDAILKAAVRAYVGSAACCGPGNVDAPGLPVSEVRDHALDLVAREVSDCMHQLNAINRPSSLPAEVLAGVFIHLSVQDRFSASEVCRQWRMAAVHFAGVWTDLWEFGMVSPRLDVALERTGSLPFRLEFVLDLPLKLRTAAASTALRSVLSHLAPHVYRLSALKVTLLSARPGLPMLLDALSDPAPVLTDLTIHVVPEAGSRPVLREDLFAGHAPKLTRLGLWHILLPPHRPIPALSNVTSLRFTTRSDRPAEYNTVHLGLPNLVECEIDVPCLSYPTVVSTSFPAAPRLQVVRYLHPCRAATLAEALRPYAGCPRISVLETTWTQIASIWESALAAPTRAIALGVHGSTLLGGQDDAGAARLFRNVNDHRHTADLLAHAAPRLRALVMDTGRWPGTDGTELAFPLLQRLHVVVRPAGDASLPARPLLPVWMRAPALRTLRIDVSESAAGCLSGELAAFMPRIGCRAPVSLELQGAAEEVHLPEGLLLCPVISSLSILGADPEDVLEHWDDWLADALAQLQDR